MRRTTEKFLAAWNESKTDKLLFIPMFIIDFLCIHPFYDGNGRMIRLLSLLLFYRAGFIVGKYISIEMLIEQTKETYYEALQDCSDGWHENHNSYEPFVKYYLGVLIKASNEFESRVEYLSSKKISKPERVKTVIKNTVGKVTKKEILEKCPDISTKMVERTLADLLKAGLIQKIGASSARRMCGVKAMAQNNKNIRITYAQQKLLALIEKRELRSWCLERNLPHASLYKLAVGQTVPTFKAISYMLPYFAPVEWLYFTDEEIPCSLHTLPAWNPDDTSVFIQKHKKDWKAVAEHFGIAEENARNIFVNRRANFTLMQMRRMAGEVNPEEWFRKGDLQTFNL